MTMGFWNRVAAVFLAAMLLAGIPGVTKAYGEEKDERPVTMEVESVYGTRGKLGVHIPLKVRLYGQSSRNFEGAVRVSTMESRGDGEAEQYDYQFPVAVKPGETRIEEVYVPLGQKNNGIVVGLLNEEGTLLESQPLSFKTSGENRKLLIGLLSEKPDQLSWFDQINLDYGMVQSETIVLEGENFPTDARGLELLDLLVINRYDTDSLGKESLDALMDWVEDGGILLFGTGTTTKKTLGQFSEELFSEEPVVTGREVISMGVQYAENSPGDSDVEVTWTEVSMADGKPLTSDGDMPVLNSVSRGRGEIGVFSFDLGEISGFVRESPSYGIWLLTGILGEDKISNLYFYGSVLGDVEFWNAQSLVNSGRAERLPNLAKYTVVIFVYILIAGPGIYYLLKKKEAGRHYGAAVMLFALLSSAAVYLLGVKTRFTSEFLNYALIRDVSLDLVTERSYLNIRTPDSRPYMVSIQPEYQVTPLTKDSRYDERPIEDFTENGSGNLTIAFEGSGTVISARNSRAFEPRMFRLDKESQNTEGEGILSELQVFDGMISGTVTNRFSFPVENAAIIFYGQVLPLGRMEAGEVRKFSGERLLTYSVDMNYMLASKLAGALDYQEVDVENAEYLEAMEKSGFYSVYLDKYFGAPTSGARFVGFGPEEAEETSIVQSGQSAEGMVIYTAELQVDNEQDGMVYRSGFLKNPEMASVNGSYSRNVMMIYGTDPVVIEYFLGTDIDVEKVDFLPVSPEFFEGRQYQYVRNFSGPVWFYNQDTKNYDEIDLIKQEFTGGELEPYLSAGNSLTVRYIGSEAGPEDYSYYSQMLPYLMVTGRER